MSPSFRKSRDRLPYKQGLLFTLLGLLILVEVLTVFAVLGSQRFATERALREYTHDLLISVVDETRENAAAYLQQARDSVALASGVFEAGLVSGDNPRQLDRYFLEQLRVVPQIGAIFYGDLQGNFVFSKRAGPGPDGGYFSKLIRTGLPPATRVTLIRRDPGLGEQSNEHDENDRFDPRTRPWFELARKSDRVVWTAPYIFYTAKRPGLTAARAIHDAQGALLGVVGADIEISALSEFLEKQRVGKSGAAFIVYSNGDVLAHPHKAGLAQPDGNGGLRLKKLGELDAVTALAGQHLNNRFPDLSALDQPHYDKFQVGDRSYLSMFVPLLSQGQDQWVMGVYAPEDELARKIREGQRESIFLGVAVSALVITAAILVGLIVLRPIYTLQQQAQEDPLTGLLNRRSFDDLGARHVGNGSRGNGRVSAMMIDIDCFKPINDEYGHAVGDEVLVAVARRLSGALSDTDILARYGGEEFAVILPEAGLDQSRMIAERLRETIASQPMKTSVAPLNVTISIGVTDNDPDVKDLSDLLYRADRRLLAAKREGRNRVVAADRT